MIDHMYIKNYKAFAKENIPLGKNTLLIGTNQTGKTTVLEALDLFFNNTIKDSFIRDKEKDVIVELHINDKRYRKVYSPPNYHLNFQKCIGNMFEINKIKYLYIPNQIDTPKLLNDIITINMSKQIDSKTKKVIFKAFDYLDGVLGNDNYPIFEHKCVVKMDIKNKQLINHNNLPKIISSITYHPTILGIDNVEKKLDFSTIENIGKYMIQTIYTTNDEQYIEKHKYYVSALYKGNKEDDFDTIKKRLKKASKIKYLLVEGKYDVNWYEKAIELLGLNDKYVVIPCGGFGNIKYVQKQLEKEGYHTIVLTDGDVPGKNALRKEIVELYADPYYVNKVFNTNFKTLPNDKHYFFKTIGEKDDTVKHVLSSWARKNLTIDHPFVKEVKKHLN